MIIISNSLLEKADEGCVKVASSFVKRLKKDDESTFVITYGDRSAYSDIHLTLNKFLFSFKLSSIIRRHDDSVLYIPFPAGDLATAIRIFVLSLLSKKKVTALLTMKCNFKGISQLLLKMSGGQIIALSNEVSEMYQNVLPKDRVCYLKAGVDTKKFVPVSEQVVKDLKEKYGLNSNKKVILHVGHLKYGRGVDRLLQIDENYQVVLVVSTLTKEEQDNDLKEKILSASNIKLIDSFLPNIEEIYQMADVYFFPVSEERNCIDIPLSCMEAAACNKPIVTTRYGEMREFEGKDGFIFIDSFDSETINNCINEAIKITDVNTRQAVIAYDWDEAIKKVKEFTK